jgi:Rod binding domain-containing protein
MSREMYDERLCDTLARRGTLGVATQLHAGVSRNEPPVTQTDESGGGFTNFTAHG